MKSANFFLSVIFAALLFSCASVNNSKQSGTIVRDCTGTYLRIGENNDYLICNSDLLNDKKDGEKVSLVFVHSKDCPERDGKIMCMMYHENKGMIRVKSIK